MLSGILVIDGKVVLGPVKFGEAELAYKSRLREGSPCVIDLWSSSSSKRAKIKEPPAPAIASKPLTAEPAPSKKNPAKK